MKTKLVLALTALLALTGCNAIGNQTATVEEGAGDAWVLYKGDQIDTGASGTAAQQSFVSTMGRVESDLKSFGSGTLTANELGYVNALLASEKLLVPSNVNPNVENQLTQLINIFSTNVVNGSNGTVTPTQALAAGAIANAILGMKNGIGSEEGKWALTNPGVWPVPPTPPSALNRAVPLHTAALPWQAIAMR